MDPAGNIVDPNAVLDWSWDWSDWLMPTETIVTKTITVTEGTATVASPTEAAGIITAFVSVPVGTRVTLRCRIVTSSGRTDDRSILLIPTER